MMVPVTACLRNKGPFNAGACDCSHTSISLYNVPHQVEHEVGVGGVGRLCIPQVAAEPRADVAGVREEHQTTLGQQQQLQA